MGEGHLPRFWGLREATWGDPHLNGLLRMHRSCMEEVYRMKGQPVCVGDLIVLEQRETKLW